MKVECPNCKTTFNLQDDAVGPDGANARCGVCKHVFHVSPPRPDAPSAPSGKKPLDDTLATWLTQEYKKEHPEEPAEKPAEKPAPAVQPALAAVPVPVKKDVPAAPENQEEFVSAGLSGGEWFLIIVLVLAVVIGVSLGAAHVFKSWPFEEPAAPGASPAAQAAPEKPAEPQQPEAPLQYAGQIKFSPYTSFVVDNEKMGAPGAPAKLFVIDGKLTNNSPQTLGRISVDATLLDDKNAPVDKKSFIAGPRASLADLKTLGKEDLESRLRSEQDVMLTNSQVKPGDSVPFMVYFVNIPDSVKNYSLKPRGYSVVQPKAQEGESQPHPSEGQQPPAQNKQ